MDHFGNKILDALSVDDRNALAPELERVDFPAKLLLSEAGRVPDHIYFPSGGILSLTMSLPQGGPAAFGIIGREGLSSLSSIARQTPSPVSAIVQIAGPPAWRIATASLRGAVEDRAGLRMPIYEFVYGFTVQMAFTAVSNARHTLTARLSRWLLMCDDRLDTNEIPLTHEFMANMLGAQRTSITTTLHVLEGRGAIRNRRGIVYVVDRQTLEEAAGEAYHRSLRTPGILDEEAITRALRDQEIR